jgi:two-component system, cell cycle sensor histidine kinase PleC
VKFTPSGGSVAVEARTLSNGSAAVFVRDTGVGMDEEEISVAMTPFGQVDGRHTRWREGTGLGLPIAKALVELHGGTLEIRSAKTIGTEVGIFLPPPHILAYLQQHAGSRATAGRNSFMR